MRVALAFPELGRDKPGTFMRQANSLADKPDLLVLPENTFISPHCAKAYDPQVEACLQRFSDSSGIAVVAGIGYSGTPSERDWRKVDNWALLARPGYPVVRYHKHTSSARTALDGWVGAADQHLPVFDINGQKIGLTICHDLFISPLQRWQAQQGAEALINISFANVRAYQWRTMLQAQAVTNHLPMLYSLHRDVGGINEQKAIYAFGPKGEFNLLAADGQAQGDLAHEERVGKIYTIDTRRPKYLTDLPVLKSHQQWNSKQVIASDGTLLSSHRRYHTIDVSLQEFLHRPEVMWRYCLDLPLGVVPTFRVLTGEADYAANRAKVHAIAPARMIEFGTLTVFQAEKPLAICYRSSNYKDTRFSEQLPKSRAVIDDSYLFGPTNTLRLMAGHYTGVEHSQYRENLSRLIYELGVPFKATAAPVPAP